MPDTLFYIEPVPTGPRVSPDRRRTIRQREAIAHRAHPLTLALGRHLALHPAASTDRDGTGPRCGDCRFRAVIGGHSARSWPKCTYDRPARITGGPGTDVRAWWPACGDHEIGDPSVDWPDAARWTPQ